MRKLLGGPALLLTACAIGAWVAGCGDGEGGDATPASVPDGAVAIVGEEEIRPAEVERRTAILRRAQSRGSEATDDQLERQALALLLQESALEQEAERLGVTVSDAEVHARLRAAIRQFPSRRDYRRFLGGQTEADLRRDLHRQLLNERIAEAARERGEDPERLMRGWSRRTACLERYASAGCADGDGRDGDPASRH